MNHQNTKNTEPDCDRIICICLYPDHLSRHGSFLYIGSTLHITRWYILKMKGAKTPWRLILNNSHESLHWITDEKLTTTWFFVLWCCKIANSSVPCLDLIRRNSLLLGSKHMLIIYYTNWNKLRLKRTPLKG